MKIKINIRRSGIAVFLFVIMTFFSACGTDKNITDAGEDVTQIVLTTGFEKDEVFRIGKSSCNTAEYMVYLTNMQNHYEVVYGKEIWSVSGNGIIMEERVKENVAERIAQVKVMNLLAEEYQVVLTPEEENLILQAAKEYYSSLNQVETEALNITEEAIAQMYREYLISHKVYAYIIRDINPEISDDEARSVTVDWILFRSPEDNAEVEITAKTVLQQLQSGTDFYEMASQYSDDPTVSHSFGKGTVDPVVESCAFNLAEGEISQVIKGADGYYIIRCVSTLDREETDVNKEKIITSRKKEAFNEVYGTFAKEQIKQMNDALWNDISMLHDEQITTNSFFDVYDKYFAVESDNL